MKRIKAIKKCVIYAITPKEMKDFEITSEFAIVLKDVEKELKEFGLRIEVGDRDCEVDTLQQAEEWCNNY